MSTEVLTLTDRYVNALTQHLHQPSEASLSRAYELGREAINHGMGILDLLAVHHEAMTQWLPRARSGAEAAVVASAAAEFLNEAAGPMEMALLGFQNAADTLRSLNARLESEVATRAQQILDANVRLRQADMERRKLLRKLSQAQEEERKILANALHDDTVQILTAAMLRLDMLGHRESDPKIGADLRALSEQLVDAIKRCRHLLFVLRPSVLDREGLRVAVDELVQRATNESEIRSSLVFGCAAEPGEHVSTVIFRVLDEAIRNAQKHSKAAMLTIEISDLMHGIDVICRDDGEGFDPGGIDQARPGHLGLGSMRERVEIIGGTWELGSAPGQGTEIHFWVPLELSD
jgi:signal transduction histidine kinase